MSNTKSSKAKSSNIGKRVLAALLAINTGRRALVVFVVIFVITFLLTTFFHVAFYFYNQTTETNIVEISLDYCIEGAVGCSYPEIKTSEIDGNIEVHLGECVEAEAQCVYRGILKTPEIKGIDLEGYYLLEVDGQGHLFNKEYSTVTLAPLTETKS